MKYETCLITGGTGTFGHAYVIDSINQRRHRKLVVYSRDEYKQIEMFKFLREMFADCVLPKSEFEPYSITINGVGVRFLIGDICDYERILVATRNVDLVIHAAALKHVPICEYNPIEATKTNVTGTQNVVNASGVNGVKKVVALGTDKAVDPVNTYGATKLCLEKIVVGGNRYYTDTVFCVVRYGNILGSRGSIIYKILSGKMADSIDITDPEMTRFWLTIEEAVGLVVKALDVRDSQARGVTFVPKLKSLSVGSLFGLLCPDLKTKIIGARVGEKVHERMISDTELGRTFYDTLDDCYKVDGLGALASKAGGDGCFYAGGNRKYSPVSFDSYSSDNVELFEDKEFTDLLNSSIINRIYGFGGGS